jgi:antirestriction protein ArdC
MTMQHDLHQSITDRIVAALEAGTRPWECSWTRSAGGITPRRVTGQPYRGINVLLLWHAASVNGYSSGRWMTFKQADALGGKVRKGEKSTEVVFFKKLEVKDRNATEEDATKSIPMLRSYRVFNVDQIDNLPDRFAPAPVQLIAGKERDQAAEAALRAGGASIAEDGGDRAYYALNSDSIHLPAFDRFKSVGGYLATLAHELVHWTGAKHRLDRFGANDRTAYAFEELVAEIGAAFVCARLDIAGEHFENHAAYVASWLKALKDDKRLIFKAASLAQQAADMVLEHAGEDKGAVPLQPAPAAEPAQFALAI